METGSREENAINQEPRARDGPWNDSTKTGRALGFAALHGNVVRESIAAVAILGGSAVGYA